MRKKENKVIRKKSFIYKGAVVLSTIVIFGVSTKVVYSDPQFDITVKYLNDIYDPQISRFDPQNNKDHQWYFNKDKEGNYKISFEVDFSEYYKDVRDNFYILNEETEIPFVIIAKVVTENGVQDRLIEEQDIKIDKVSENGEFKGKYNVMITAPEGNNDDKVNIEVLAKENNSWGIPNGLSEDIYVIRDIQNPEISVKGISDNSMAQNNVFINLLDNNIETTEMTINLSIDGEKVKTDEKYEGESNLTIDTSKDGHYTGKITARDKAWNIADEQIIDFYVNKIAPTIKFNGDYIKPIYNTKNIEVLIQNDSNIDFDKSKYKLYNTADLSNPIDIPAKSIIKEDEKRVKLKLNIPSDGEYKLVPEIYNVGNILNNIDPDAYIFKVDTVDPIVESSGVDKDEVKGYKENKTILFTIKEKNLKEVKLNGTIIDKSKLIQDSQNKDLYTYEYSTNVGDGQSERFDLNLIATDEVGRKSNLKEISFIVDKKEPTVHFYNKSNDAKLENNKVYNMNEVKVKVSDEYLSDDNISINVKRYLNDDDTKGSIYKIKNNKFENGELIIPFNEEGIYSIQVDAKDNNGNSTKVEEDYIKFVIDKKKPVINIEDQDSYKSIVEPVIFTVDEENFEQSDLKVTVIKTKPDSELKEILEIEDKIKKISEENGVSQFELIEELFEEDAKYDISINLTDKADNPIDGGSKNSVSFIVDKSEPIIEVRGIDDGMYYKDSVEFSTIITDNNHNTNTISVTKNGVPYDVGVFTGEGKERKLEHKFIENGDYVVNIESIDKANKETHDTIAFTIDKEAPQLKIVDSTDGQDIVQGKHYDKFKNIDVILTDDNIESYELIVNEQEEKFEEFEAEDNKKIYKYTVEANQDGEYEVSVKAKDLSGNDLTEDGEPKITTFVIDTTNPVVNIDGFNDLNESFNKKVDSVKVNIDEINFDKNNLKVNLKVTEPNKETKTTVIEGKDIDVIQLKDKIGNPIAGKYEFVLDKMFTVDGKYDISLEMTDISGNPIDESSKNSVSFTVDNNIPDIKVVTPGDKKYYKNNEVPLEVRIKDNNHDVNRVTIEKVSKKLGEKEEVEKVDYTDFLTEGSEKVFRETLKGEGTYNIMVYSKDKSGNENSLPQVYSFVIDRTEPVIETNFSSINETYSNPQKNAYIKVSEVNWKNQYTGEALMANVKGEKITPDNKVTPIDLSFPLTGEVTEVNYANEFADDAIYNLNVSISDSAGIFGKSQSVKFVTDKTAPTISIEGIENDQHYNMDRYLVIRNTDVNHNINEVTVKRNGAEYPIGDFVTEGRDKIVKHTFTQEGEYEVSVTSTDKAGNNVVHPTVKFTIDKTAPVITPLNSNENKVLQNGQYINKLFIPEFKLDKPEDDKIDLIEINGKGNFANSTLVADKEIEYKYKVVASDKAKNATNLDIGFTVDVTLPEVKVSGILSGFFSKDMRPVYDITDKNLDKEKTTVTLNGVPFESGTVIKDQENYNLKLIATDLANNVVTKTIGFTIDKDKPVIRFEEEISGKYFTEDFIPNFVIDDLTDYTIISMTLDGEDYEVGQEIEKEGKHVLYIEVKDKAENIESISVEFILDKTPPKFIIDGVEEDGKYKEGVSAKIKLDNPNDTIKSIKVNGKVAEGNIKDEDGQEVATIDFNEVNNYEIELIAADDAGNITEETISFEVVDKNIFVRLYKNKAIFYPITAIVVAMLMYVIFIILKRPKKDEENTGEDEQQ